MSRVARWLQTWESQSMTQNSPRTCHKTKHQHQVDWLSSCNSFRTADKRWRAVTHWPKREDTSWQLDSFMSWLVSWQHRPGRWQPCLLQWFMCYRMTMTAVPLTIEQLDSTERCRFWNRLVQHRWQRSGGHRDESTFHTAPRNRDDGRRWRHIQMSSGLLSKLWSEHGFVLTTWSWHSFAGPCH